MKRKPQHKEHPILSKGTAACIKAFIAVWAFSGDSLSLMLSGYSTDVPVIKYIYTLLCSLDGWGIQTIFALAGLCTIFYLVRDRQRSPWVSGISAFFAISTVIGISYAKTDSWDCIFLFKLQFALAVFVTLGYYFTYKNCILLAGYLLERKKSWLRSTPLGKAELFLFRDHTFAGPLLLIWILGLPWLIFYFPGTLQWDAHAQLWIFLGAAENTGAHPVIATQIMGGCVWLGRQLFHSDTIGLFLYNITQFSVQSLTFAYACHCLRKMNCPIVFSWGALLYWTVFPYFPIWGYTMVKDTPFYVFILLIVVVWMDIIYGRNPHGNWRQICLLLCGVSGTVLFRNDGRYVVLVTLLGTVLLYRQYWLECLAGIACCLLLTFMIDGIYMPSHQIEKGNTADMLSIPLQQTARYLREHYEELTEEEAKVLQEGFTVSLDQVAAAYNPICSDPVKENFQKHPNTAYLKAYFRVWLQQLVKHPDTYIQAFLNHTYGYFYPDMHDHQYDTLHYTAFFHIGNSDKWHDGHLDMEFAVEDDTMREILRHSLYLVEKMPLFSMLLSAGMHTYLLLGECAYLLSKKKRREMLFLIPGLFILLLRIASPVNAYVRYIMPIMVMLPVTAPWCYIASHRTDVKQQAGKEETLAA